MRKTCSIRKTLFPELPSAVCVKPELGCGKRRRADSFCTCGECRYNVATDEIKDRVMREGLAKLIRRWK